MKVTIISPARSGIDECGQTGQGIGEGLDLEEVIKKHAKTSRHQQLQARKA